MLTVWLFYSRNRWGSPSVLLCILERIHAHAQKGEPNRYLMYLVFTDETDNKHRYMDDLLFIRITKRKWWAFIGKKIPVINKASFIASKKDHSAIKQVKQHASKMNLNNMNTTDGYLQKQTIFYKSTITNLQILGLIRYCKSANALVVPVRRSANFHF